MIALLERGKRSGRTMREVSMGARQVPQYSRRGASGIRPLRRRKAAGARTIILHPTAGRPREAKN